MVIDNGELGVGPEFSLISGLWSVIIIIHYPLFELKIENLKLILLFLEPLDALRQGGAELVDRLQRVVEGDDRAVARVALHVVEHTLARHPLGVVARHEVPHHNLVLAAEPRILHGAHPAVGRPHEVAAYVGVGLLHVVAVVVQRVAESADMVVCMVAYLMAFVDDAPEEVGIFPHVVAHHEEGGLDAVVAQRVEDEGCRLGNGAVVEP